jgi:hypothetical protein
VRLSAFYAGTPVGRGFAAKTTICQSAARAIYVGSSSCAACRLTETVVAATASLRDFCTTDASAEALARLTTGGDRCRKMDEDRAGA